MKSVIARATRLAHAAGITKSRFALGQAFAAAGETVARIGRQAAALIIAVCGDGKRMSEAARSAGIRDRRKAKRLLRTALAALALA